MLAAAVFLVATLAIRSAPKDVLVPDSIALRGVTRAELLYELAGRPPVDLLLIGTSRLEKVSTRRIVRQLDRSEISVLNLSVPRNSFFTIETVLRNNPTLLRNLSIIFVDIYPYQFDNGIIDGASSVTFLRYKSPEQTSWPSATADRLISLTDSVVPIWSRTQSLNEWITGIQLFKSPPQDRLRFIKNEQFRVGLREWNRYKEAYEEDIFVSALPPFDISRIQLRSLSSIRQMLNDDTVLVLLWLPSSEEGHRRKMDVDRKRYTHSVSEGRRLAAEFAEDHANVQFVEIEDWLVNPFEQTDFTWDGAHFTETGLPKLADGLARITNDVLAGAAPRDTSQQPETSDK